METSRLGSRIRDVLRQGGTRHGTGVPPPAVPAASDVAATLDALGGTWQDADDAQGAGGEACLVVEREYPADGRHGHDAVGEYARLTGELAGHVGVLAGHPDQPVRPPLLFFDLETTGLSGGAGTQAFLVGCGFFDGSVFRTRQFFLTSYAAERRLLLSVAAQLAGAGVLVTFNGKTFDLPVIETRYLFHRLAVPSADLPHLDMLHPARRMWRGARADGDDADGDAEARSGCTLGALERAVLGFRRTGDVPGSEIPARYFHYVRTGEARPLVPVFEHNRLDLLSLAGLTVRGLRLLEGGPATAGSPRECLALGRMYERLARRDEAADAYERAAGWPGSEDETALVRVEALRRLATLHRRERRHAQAASLWEALIDDEACPPAVAREAAEALAVHHEHRSHDLLAARRYARRCLTHAGTRAEQQARKRLARVERKLDERTPATVGGLLASDGG
ncbi:MAG TPA: ribonuclease H-like domain-containing protein [Vicinamibacterales bacterium]|nr:ribonuclease H-like domain-containing protein [Vicinamibacterales bacterium]